MLEKEINNINNKIDKLSDPRKRKLLISITKKKDWYKKVSLDTLISVLMDLGYSKEDAIDLFKRVNLGE